MSCVLARKKAPILDRLAPVSFTSRVGRASIGREDKLATVSSDSDLSDPDNKRGWVRVGSPSSPCSSMSESSRGMSSLYGKRWSISGLASSPKTWGP